jgi:hypothetical protein
MCPNFVISGSNSNIPRPKLDSFVVFKNLAGWLPEVHYAELAARSVRGSNYLCPRSQGHMTETSGTLHVFMNVSGVFATRFYLVSSWSNRSRKYYLTR